MAEGRTLSLPVDPTEDELSSRWRLSAKDLEQIYRCRGDHKRFSFALQLCVLRNCGRPLGGDFTSVPVRILNHVGRQLGLPPLLSVAPPARPATDVEHEQRIREYLGFSCMRSPITATWTNSGRATTI